MARTRFTRRESEGAVSERRKQDGRLREEAHAIAPPLIRALAELGRTDLAVAGGKGANLGELIRAGLPVPPGFVVTTVAYDRFVAANGLAAVIDRTLSEHRGGAPIREAFMAAPIPSDIEEAVLAAYQRLGLGPVAVRSSATAEDLPEAAFAGQQETFLNVIGREGLLDAVRRCWASLWTDRAIAYRERLRLDQRTVKLAVVVQSLVAAEYAGVMFTANPVTGARDEVVIDAGLGLGEAVVAGLVTPDRYVLRRRWRGWRVVEHRPGRREVVVRPLAGGGIEQVKPCSEVAGGVLLPAEAAQRLASLGTATQRHFGAPQDVEWAWTAGRPFILQARPITALPEPPPHPHFLQRLLAGLIAELIPSRPYPLEATTWGFEYVFSALLGPMFRPIGLAVRLQGFFREEDGVLVQCTGHFPLRPTWRVVLAPLRLRRLARRYDPARWREDPLLAEAQARTQALATRDLASLSWEEVLDVVREALAIPTLIGELRVRYLVPRLPALVGLRVLLSLLGAGGKFGTLVFTGIDSVTMEMNRALERLAASVRDDPVLAEAFARTEAGNLLRALTELPAGRALLGELRHFLAVYGHRETGGTVQISQPSWVEVPEVVLGILQGLAAAPPQTTEGRPAWETVRDELLRHPLLRIPLLRSAFLRLLMEARWFPLLREDTRFYATMPLPYLRRALLELGRRLVATGVLESPQDVFHLKLAEVEGVAGKWPPLPEDAAALRSLVVRRRAKLAELEHVPLVDPRLLGAAEPAGDALLRGVPGSPGVAEGPARVIRSSAEFGRLRAGEVLVAPYTNPTWTPLFQQAVAVVVDSGGIGSHAAIVAREYHIPAVMATMDGTSRLRDGDWVRVDGNRGLVLRAQPRLSG